MNSDFNYFDDKKKLSGATKNAQQNYQKIFYGINKFPSIQHKISKI